MGGCGHGTGDHGYFCVHAIGAPPSALTLEKLSLVEEAEAMLQREGLRHFRVRNHGDIARIEVAPGDLPWIIEPARRTRITTQLKELGFKFVTVDLDGYRPGGISLS